MAEFRNGFQIDARDVVRITFCDDGLFRETDKIVLMPEDADRLAREILAELAKLKVRRVA